MPEGVLPEAKAISHENYGSERKTQAGKAFDVFVKSDRARYPKATKCLEKDKGVVLAFRDFPAEHWAHIRLPASIDLRPYLLKL